MDIAELSMFLETLQSKVISDEEFEESVQKVKSLQSIDGQHRLILYALYKQSTIGDINIPQPPNSDIIESSKWLLILLFYFTILFINYYLTI